MPTDNDTAIAYAHICDAITNWDSLLNVLYDTMLPEDMMYAEAIGKQLSAAKEALKP